MHDVLAPGWVYSLADYHQMFDLSDADLGRRILDFPAGISSFNAEMKALGHLVRSGDQIYDLSPDEMEAFARKVLEKDKAHLREHAGQLKAEDPNVLMNEIFAAWDNSMHLFLQDYALGLEEGRYEIIGLEQYSHENHEFQLALCSDLLFHTQTIEHYSPEALVTELARVAEEVRVFPLLDEKGVMSEAVGPVILELQQRNLGVEIREVPYEQQVGGNAMLRVWAKECHVV